MRLKCLAGAWGNFSLRKRLASYRERRREGRNLAYVRRPELMPTRKEPSATAVSVTSLILPGLSGSVFSATKWSSWRLYS